MTTIGYNHICFAVEDLDATIAKLKGAGVEMLNSAMEFRDYKMEFIRGPEGVTIELVQRLD